MDWQGLNVSNFNKNLVKIWRFGQNKLIAAQIADINIIFYFKSLPLGSLRVAVRIFRDAFDNCILWQRLKVSNELGNGGHARIVAKREERASTIFFFILFS